MRSLEDREAVRALIASGANNCEIVRQTGVPLTTVRNWRTQPPAQQPHLCPLCGNAALPNPEAYVYLLGLYLGDGHIVECPRRVFRLSVYLDAGYPGIIGEAREAMAAVRVEGRIGARRRQDRCVEVYSCWKHWPCLFPQHGPGMKHLRQIELREWQADIVGSHPARLLRGLIHSDGCRGINRVRARGVPYEYPRYQFTNFSPDIRAIFCRAYDDFGVRWTQSNSVTISVSRAGDVAKLDSVIGPKS
jgi:hypothetical protein